MNIGIYGDSFAHYNVNCLDFNWTVMLCKKFTNSNLNHYGKSSTSVYFSYKQFIDTYYKNDVNIFLVTNPARYTKPVNVNNEEVFLSYINSVEHYKKENIKNLSSLDIKILDDLLGWYISSDHEFLSTMSELMLNHLKLLDDKIILFPCFATAFTTEQYNKYEIPEFHYMYNYVNRAKELLNINEPDLAGIEVPTTIAQHLTPEFNQFVADFMYKKITSNVWDFSKFEDVKLEHPKEYYYKL